MGRNSNELQLSPFPPIMSHRRNAGGVMDSAIVNALKEKAELEARLTKISQFLALYDEFSRTKGETSDTRDVVEVEIPDDQEPITYQPFMPIPNKGPTVRYRFGPNALVTLAVGAMKDLGRPLTRGELVDAL